MTPHKGTDSVWHLQQHSRGWHHQPRSELNRERPGSSYPGRDKQLIRSIKRLALAGVAAAALTAVAFAGPASASVTVNADGTGFVGKGDVQTVLGLNNAQMQNTPVSFTMKSTTTQSFDWTCVKTMVTGNGTVKETRQERANVTTTDVTAVVSNVARVKNQITGYNLTGLGATTTTSVVDGPAPQSCPDASSGFELDPDSVVSGVPSTTNGFFVNGVSLPITPAPVVS
jgi:hypothetical protein